MKLVVSLFPEIYVFLTDYFTGSMFSININSNLAILMMLQPQNHNFESCRPQILRCFCRSTAEWRPVTNADLLMQYSYSLLFSYLSFVCLNWDTTSIIKFISSLDSSNKKPLFGNLSSFRLKCVKETKFLKKTIIISFEISLETVSNTF